MSGFTATKYDWQDICVVNTTCEENSATAAEREWQDAAVHIPERQASRRY